MDTDKYLPAIRIFLETYQSDESLKEHRQFVNVYTPHEQDIKAIYMREYDITNLQLQPSAYGEGEMFEFAVGQTTFRIWGKAAEHIKKQADQLTSPPANQPASAGKLAS
jgi:hypothetical protein